MASLGHAHRGPLTRLKRNARSKRAKLLAQNSENHAQGDEAWNMYFVEYGKSLSLFSRVTPDMTTQSLINANVVLLYSPGRARTGARSLPVLVQGHPVVQTQHTSEEIVTGHREPVIMRVYYAVVILNFWGQVRSQCLSEEDDLPPPPRPSLSQLTPFSLDLFREVVPPSGNFLFSPFSVWSALVLAYLGSRGDTKTQMERVLRLTTKDDTLALYRALGQIRESPENYTIDSANRIYVDTALPLYECVARVLPDEVKNVDFSQADLAAAEINQFVNSRTRGNIPHLVDPLDVSLARMVFVNAVYFKGFWEHQFSPRDTTRERFDVSPGRHSFVDMMDRTGMYGFGVSEELDSDVVELPYRGGAASLVVLLPRDRQTGGELDRMLQRLTPVALASAVGNLTPSKVHLKFPKFKFESILRNELIQALTRLGLRDLFSPAANLTAFSPAGGLRITNGVHKAVMEVNEEGAEASSGTALVIRQRTRPFVCNRPFLFFIHEKIVDNILFVGVFREPQTKSGDISYNVARRMLHIGYGKATTDEDK
ncbi:leukocyte elastase inhibitor-like [Penaeus indicus]|uniref:leukocyte elastase inhibitor-like n=1 Tax=Penaeus indicus TaxID=29960 RepID=UPI00300D3AD6